MAKQNRYVPTRLISEDYLRNIEGELRGISKRKTLQATANVNKLLSLRNQYARLLADGATSDEKMAQLSKVMNALIEATLEHQERQMSVKTTPKTIETASITKEEEFPSAFSSGESIQSMYIM